MYCEKCKHLFEGEHCPSCRKGRVRDVKPEDPCYLTPECVNHADKSVLNEIREAKYKHCRECLKTGFQQFVTMKTKSSMTRNMRHSDSMPYALEL